MQDYKEAAKAILKELFDDVTEAKAGKIGGAGQKEEGDPRRDLQGAGRELQGSGRDLQCPVEEAGSLDVSFSSETHPGHSEEEDIEDFASAEDEG